MFSLANSPFRRRGSHSPFASSPEDKDSIIRLGDRPCDIQSTIGNCFFLREAIGDIRFDEDLTTSEDTLFVNRVILRKCAYAVTPFCTYLYRKRQDGSSLSQVITYAKHMQNLDVCERMFEASRRVKGRVLPFAQAVALYIIGWQLFGQGERHSVRRGRRELVGRCAQDCRGCRC